VGISKRSIKISQNRDYDDGDDQSIKMRRRKSIEAKLHTPKLVYAFGRTGRNCIVIIFSF